MNFVSSILIRWCDVPVYILLRKCVIYKFAYSSRKIESVHCAITDDEVMSYNNEDMVPFSAINLPIRFLIFYNAFRSNTSWNYNESQIGNLTISKQS
ncbi:Schizosaccharomyces pombe specific protein [Schizosaccharomyces pombe]|uniref:Uncharacterized protein C7D4.08 n=1 Tax=Schizosaccharomyces pombe (strain 972 / ATCC 24843) TaxID=284812 RepID=YFP8_SCHPO|nr:uncharacterized protein SPAC7D4.08 [Schizosaccharomyces pombe]O14263.2 RecName: Full=Uncharacterized protein C7D4.08 [Schizosaccharomyces pombe 972h-]CAB16725.2 sequence orphan [Schizosaccharomyces pombe]|eukprot:NP_593851.1 uncharacterized protein SPAC7D4.08 [Schizosaccharomyces pombe]